MALLPYLSIPDALRLCPHPGHSTHGPESPPGREIKGTVRVPMAVVNTDIPGLSPRNPHYIPGYTGHCPLLRYSMGQTYGQVTGFIPQAQFMFAKNCNQVWAEAMNNFTQRQGQQESHEPSEEAGGGKEAEKDQEAEEPELKQEVAQTSPYSMDDTDPQKFFMSGFTGYVPRARFLFGSSFPVLTNQALQEFGQKCSKGRVQKDPKPLSPLPRPNFQNLGLLPHYGGYVPGYKFQFGGTFGHLTHDALGLSTTQKQLLA
ncbi:hypothetical protein ACRRTK_021340 [Alexandromys fortis]